MNIRCASINPDGQIEAVDQRTLARVVMDRRTGEAVHWSGNAKPGTDAFRRLIRAAREWKAP